MTKPPSDPVKTSHAAAGDLHDEPESAIGVVVSDEDNEPVGILESWSEDAWIYADVDDLEDLN